MSWYTAALREGRVRAMVEVGPLSGEQRQTLERYLQEGAGGLEDRPRPGRPPKDRLARQIVDAQLSNPPVHSGPPPTCWTVGLLATFLATRFRLTLAPSS